jgi:hypothetical protein
MEAKIGNFKYSYWKEFWYKRSENGNLQYIPNTRKFWATISWVILCLWFVSLFAWVIYSIISKQIVSMPWSFVATFTGILIGNAQVAVGWYTLDMNNIRKYSSIDGEPIGEIFGKGKESDIDIEEI